MLIIALRLHRNTQHTAHSSRSSNKKLNLINYHTLQATKQAVPDSLLKSLNCGSVEAN